MKPSNTEVTKQITDVEHGDCLEINKILARIGEKWTILIILLLAYEPKRFNEIKKAINGISQRMLTVSLKSLERDGLLKRTVYEIMPPHVEYELTPLGQSLTQPINELVSWTRGHLSELKTARDNYDEQQLAKEGSGKTPWQKMAEPLEK
ncbi:winged helix-turn-helix transcriptional regulator [Colwellia echini]|uniref:Helix-turn-helix transcriptional regulator n=1 Tax=Colwellia echini TaxID=1982103 RepID=A0ABY3MU48_9GAMM|nr:helix-turn-helix domain-containing protein [Colwellia echini]TYK64646.1 helix-turn-helix transcriptional regulator [Colwellia echini]